MSSAGVLLRIEGSLGHITLNRPDALNALTLPMIEAIDGALTAWEKADVVQTVVIDGTGAKGLCAGGDIRMIYEASLTGEFAPALSFFRAEYQLNSRLGRFGKPVVALMSGLVIGGGVGISAHTAHRVVTGTTSLAMPEVSIGFIPDVGGTYLLSRAPGELGTHLALTGARVGAADAITLGLADLYVDEGRLGELVAALRTCGSAEVGATLLAFSSEPPQGVLENARSWIDAAYAAADVGEILTALTRAGDEQASRAADEIRKNSPTSLKITLRALREARRLKTLDACLEMEFRIATACLARHDMREGIRAAVIDKDRRPQWSPSTLEGVTTEMVDDHMRGMGPTCKPMTRG